MMIKLFLFLFLFTFAHSDFCPLNYAFVSKSVILNDTGSHGYRDGLVDVCLDLGYEDEPEHRLYSNTDSSGFLNVFTREYDYTPYMNTAGDYSTCLYEKTDRKYVCELKCPDDKIWDANTSSCIDECPPNSTYDLNSETCVCNPPYLKELVNPPSLTNENDFICKLPDCPPYYEDHTPPLPLFKQTDNVANCNFFPYSDGATLEYEGIVCCYGQEGLDNNDTCGNNELEVNGECYPITPSDPPEDDNRSCPTGEYYSLIEGHCVPFYDNNGSGGGGSGGGGSGGGGSGGGGSGGGGSGNGGAGDSVYSQDDALGSVNDALNFDRIQSVVEGAFDSYVLLPLPVTVSGTCSSEFRRTFTIFGRTYVLDLNDYMSSLYDLLPILKAIILFISVYSAIVLVLAGKGD